MDDLSEQLRKELRERGITQIELASRLGTSQPIVSRALKAAVLNERSYWPAILDLLGLEVTLRPKRAEP